jgi:hypothetical protein
VAIRSAGIDPLLELPKGRPDQANGASQSTKDPGGIIPFWVRNHLGISGRGGIEVVSVSPQRAVPSPQDQDQSECYILFPASPLGSEPRHIERRKEDRGQQRRDREAAR